VTTVVVEASETWPVVAAGLGGLVVALATLGAARKQCDADSARLVQQLAHDRTMRQQELQAASERLDRQLAQASERVDRQLARDRDMRDLQHLREALAPIAANVLDWDSFISLHKGLSDSRESAG
jgi:hypothetical protein